MTLTEREDEKSMNIERIGSAAVPDALVVAGDARIIWLTGINAGAAAVDHGAEGQARVTAEVLGERLRAAGAEWGDVVKVVEYVNDLRVVPVLREALKAAGGEAWNPARTLVQVDNLSTPGSRWELDVVVALPA